MNRTIYLEPDEEITSVIDRLTQTEENEVNLVVPAEAQILQSSINLKLLKREADNLGKNITLITADELGQRIASQAGLIVRSGFNWRDQEKEDILDVLVEELEPEAKLTVKQSVKKEQSIERGPKTRMADIVKPAPPAKPWRKIKLPWSKPRKMPEATLQRQEIPLEPLGEPARPRRIRWPRPSFKWFQLSPKFFFIFIGLTLIVAGLVAYLVLPTTEIIISPQIESITFGLQVKGSKDISQIDSILNKIPLQLVRVEKTLSREFPATGEKQLNEKARGIITVYNEYSSSPQTLVAATRFLSSEEKLFRTTQTIVVPGAKVEEGKIVPSTIEVEVMADQPGAEYNIGPADFTIPGFKGTAKYTGFYGRSKAPMTGGSTGKVKIVTSEDLEKAFAQLTEELKKIASQALEEQMPTDLKLIEGALLEEEVETSASQKAEARADNFVVEVKVAVRALLFNEKNLQDLVDLNLASQIATNKIPLAETQQIQWDKPVIDWDKTEVSLPLHIQEDMAWQIDSQTLKKDLAGLTEIEVRKYLAKRPEIEKAKVTFWPFWVKRVPLQVSKIKIVIEGVD